LVLGVAGVIIITVAAIRWRSGHCEQASAERELAGTKVYGNSTSKSAWSS
jgi:hypothetical protein